MKLILPTGEYIRPGRPTFAEAEWLFGTLLDWPAGGWTLTRCLNDLSKSAKNFRNAMLIDDPIPSFSNLVLIYCLADDTRVGTAQISYWGDTGVTGFDVEYAAIDPLFRQQGHYTKMSDGIAWFANQFLQADQGKYEALSSSPQILTRAIARGGVESYRQFSEFARTDKVSVHLDRATVDATFTKTEGFQLTINDQPIALRRRRAMRSIPVEVFPEGAVLTLQGGVPEVEASKLGEGFGRTQLSVVTFRKR